MQNKLQNNNIDELAKEAVEDYERIRYQVPSRKESKKVHSPKPMQKYKINHQFRKSMHDHSKNHNSFVRNSLQKRSSMISNGTSVSLDFSRRIKTSSNRHRQSLKSPTSKPQSLAQEDKSPFSTTNKGATTTAATIGFNRVMASPTAR